MLPEVNVIVLKLNFDQITIVNYEIIGVARATWVTSVGTPLNINSKNRFIFNFGL